MTKHQKQKNKKGPNKIEKEIGKKNTRDMNQKKKTKMIIGKKSIKV